jgi:hypothetical protein
MVSTMVSAYEGLPNEERERVFLLAVGKDDYKDDDQNFCKGFAACADESDAPWWTAWNVTQREVFFYMKTDPEDNSSWEYYCRYSMNTGKDEFDDTIREMLELVGDATSIEPENQSSDDSASSSSLNYMPFLMLSAAVLCWSMIL